MADGPEQIVQRILLKRGLKTAAEIERFLNPDYERDSHDPLLLPDMDKALARLKHAKLKGETVVIYGDYDIDGLCASAVLLEAFSSFGLKASVFIPDRFSEGYGLSATALKKLAAEGAKLVVTVDCGTSAAGAINSAKGYGLDVIVTDHHQPPPLSSGLPPAVAVVNPKRPDSRYPFDDLAGNGVAFKLVQAMQTAMDGLAPSQEKWLLDLVAFGTVCDVVTLTGENRMLVTKGLAVMAKSRRAGFKALSRVTKIPLTKVNTTTLGFVFGPRLNAAGRLTHAKTALELLTTKDASRALELALKLDQLNAERKSQQAVIERQAAEQLKAFNSDKVLVLADAGWSHGIVGIVAARLMEREQKPVFIMQILGDQAKGSVRSFGDFNAADALESVRDLLLSGGGHSAAAGFSLASANVDEFRGRLNDFYLSSRLQNQTSYLETVADVSMTTITGLNLELHAQLQALQPYGHGNREPTFELQKVRFLNVKRVGSDGSHLKVLLADETGIRLDGIAFNHRDQELPPAALKVVGRLERNDFNGRSSPQFVINAVRQA